MKLDVVGAQEAAQILGVEVTRIWRWRNEGRLPPVAADLKATPVWRRQYIAKMARRYKTTGKAPPKWTDPVEPLDVEIVGLAEVAAMLDLEKDKKAIGRWRAAGTFPEPLLEKRDPTKAKWRAGRGLAATPLWDKAHIERFAQTRADAATARAALAARA